MATDTQTYTGDMGAVENKISSLTSAVSKGYSGLPGVTAALRKSLYEREKTLPGLERDVEGKITELYTADKRLAERYANPESEMFIENPMNRQATISGQKADIRGEYGNMLNLIQSRQNVIGSALDKGLELYKAGLSAQEFELQQAEKEWDRIFKKSEAAKKGSGSASKSAGMAEFLKALITRKQGWKPTEEKPPMNPTEGDWANPNVTNWRSPKGQWEWSNEAGDWLPSGQEGTERADLELADILTKYPIIAEEVMGNWSKVFPNEEENTTQWETKKTVYQNAFSAKQSGATTEDIEAYIQAQGFDPTDSYFVSLLFEE